MWRAAGAAAIAVLVVFLLVTERSWDRERREWEERVESAEAQADSLLEEVRAHERRARAEQQRADSLERAADERGRVTRERVVEIRREEAPDTCVPFVAPRDSVIDELLDQTETWRAAFDAQKRAAAELRLARDDLLLSHDSLAAVIAARPRPRRRWLPELGVGAFAGLCMTGRPCTGVGITLSWSVPWSD